MSKVNLIDNKFQVFDDIIPKENQDEIEAVLLSEGFPWYYQDCTVCPVMAGEHQEKVPEWVPDLQLTHRFVYDGIVDSKWTAGLDDVLLKPLFGDAEVQLIRIKSNFQISNTFEIRENPPHIDSDEYEHNVCLYYVNDSDGDTVLYNEDGTEMERISPKKGRALFFRGDIYHTSSRPKDFRTRLVINMNLKNSII